TPTPLRIRLTPAGSEALANLRGSATVKMTSTLTPAAGPATTRSSTFELQSRSAPSSSSGAITSLTVAGSTADPTFVVRGSNLGKLPQASPPGHLSGQSGCPTVDG